LNPPKANFILPREVDRRQQLFEEFYKKEHNGRKLAWLHQHSTGILKTCYSLPQRRVYELQVTTYQMGILLLFNTTVSDSVTGRHIQESIQLPEKDLAFQLQTLTKNKILIASEPKEVDGLCADQTFTINSEFKSQHRKVPLHTTTQKDASDDATMKLVNTDRKHAIQAAIVRVMKARRTIAHSNLIAEVFSQLRSNFKPTVQDIKKNIDNLIEKDYMERAENTPNAYNYIA
jgi:cullin 1